MSPKSPGPTPLQLSDLCRHAGNRKADFMSKDPSHVLHRFFQLLPSGSASELLYSERDLFRNTFIPAEISISLEATDARGASNAAALTCSPPLFLCGCFVSSPCVSPHVSKTIFYHRGRILILLIMQVYANPKEDQKVKAVFK